MRERTTKNKSSRSKIRTKPSEEEIMELHKKALQQYEEGMRLADFPDYEDPPGYSYPKYSWDNPIGLVIT